MKLISYLGVACLVALSGCSSIAGGPEPVINQSNEVGALASIYNSERLLAYFNESDPHMRRAIRDQIVSARLYATDIKFSEFTQNLANELRSAAFGVDSASILLSTLSTSLDPGQQTKIISGIDTVLKGGRQSFDKDILIEKTLPILLQQMRSDRKKIALGIMSNLADHTDIEYPLTLAMNHLDEYYQAGTLSGGLTSLGDNITVLSLKNSNKNITIEEKLPALKLKNPLPEPHMEDDIYHRDTSLDTALIKKTNNSNRLTNNNIRTCDNHSNYGENSSTLKLNNYVNSAMDEPSKQSRIKKIEEKIKLYNGGTDVNWTILLNTNEQECHALQKNIVADLDLE